MFEVATLILVLYVTQSIFRRSRGRQKEIDRLNAKVAQLSDIVMQLQKSDKCDQVSELMIKMELNDMKSLLEEVSTPNDADAQHAFEQLHYVEETVSKSVVMPREMPTSAESTL